MGVDDLSDGSAALFAYGEFMARKHVRALCPGAVLAGAARLYGWRFHYNRHGRANIVPDRRHCVEGALWRLSQADLSRLSCLPVAGPSALERRRVAVWPFGADHVVPAEVLVSGIWRKGAPDPDLRDLVVTAAEDLGLSPEYIAVIRAPD